MNTPCPGCHLELPLEDGTTHAYVTTSAACWRLFAETLPGISERLFTDAYMAQHPTGDDPRQIQSVAVHLITLNAVLELGVAIDHASTIRAKGVEFGRLVGGFPSLNSPDSWDMTVADVALESVTTRQYVEHVWNRWKDHGVSEVGNWTGQVLGMLGLEAG